MRGHLRAGAAIALGVTDSDVDRITRTAPRRYKVYRIPKRSGGERTIAQPAPELKDLQYYLMDAIVSKLPVHDAAKAYRPGLSIRDNATVHAKSTAVLKMDFRDFFGSIKPIDFERHCVLNEVILADDDVEFCRQVLFWQEHRNGPLRLSMGAPSSPMVSNTVVFELDKAIGKVCQDQQIQYSRYADDLTFSANDIVPLIGIRSEMPRLLAQLPYPVLYLNHEKTVLVTRRHRRTVTGLVLTNDGLVSLGHNKKRLLRASVYAFANKALSPQQIDNLRGQIAYCKSVEPDFFARLERKYGAEVLDALLKRKFSPRNVQEDQ